jgi:hypothetical protein
VTKCLWFKSGNKTLPTSSFLSHCNWAVWSVHNSDYFHKHHLCVDLGAVYAFHLLQREAEFLNLEKFRTSVYLGRHQTACLSLRSNVRSRHDTALEFSSHDSLLDMCCYTFSRIGYPGVFYVTVVTAKFNADGIPMGIHVNGPFGRNWIKIRITRLSWQNLCRTL